jgi:hypothetical protein
MIGRLSVAAVILFLGVLPIGCGRSSQRSPPATASPSVPASPSASVTANETDSPTSAVDAFLRDETNWDTAAMLKRSCAAAQGDLQHAIAARETPEGQLSTPTPGELSVRIHLAQTGANSARVQVEGSITYDPPVGVVDITGVYTLLRESGTWCVATSNLTGNAG